MSYYFISLSFLSQPAGAKIHSSVIVRYFRIPVLLLMQLWINSVPKNHGYGRICRSHFNSRIYYFSIDLFINIENFCLPSNRMSIMAMQITALYIIYFVLSTDNSCMDLLLTAVLHRYRVFLAAPILLMTFLFKSPLSNFIAIGCDMFSSNSTFFLFLCYLTYLVM